MSNKYNEKMKDSFHSKFKTFFFTKAFDEAVEAYIKNEDQTIKDEFNSFILTPEIAKKYASEYYQSKKNDKIEFNGNTLTVEQIIKNLSMNCDGHDYYVNTSLLRKEVRNILKNRFVDIYDMLLDEYGKNFSNIFPIDEFEEMNKNIKSCEYCGISLEQINRLASSGKLNNKRSETRGYSLEIDRKNPNLEYTRENCCMSCYWCNNAKTDEFFPHEFKEIAKGINYAWNERFVQLNIDERIVFPDKSYIWSSMS